MASVVKGSFSATGFSAEEEFKAGDFHISGSFVGTVQLQRRIGTVWQPIAQFTDTGTVIDDETTFENGTAKTMRFQCIAYTSGTINYHME